MPTTLDLFKSVKDTIPFAAGETLLREGEEGNLMFVIQEGEVELWSDGKMLETLQPGGIVGEMALIEGKPHEFTAIAKTDVKLVPISQKQFSFMLQETPNFAMTVMRIMIDRLRRLYDMW